MNFKSGDIVNITPTRKVLFEKYDLKNDFGEIEHRFLCAINGCEVLFDKSIHSYYFIKKDTKETMFRLRIINHNDTDYILWANYELFWTPLNYDYVFINQSLIFMSEKYLGTKMAKAGYESF